MGTVEASESWSIMMSWMIVAVTCVMSIISTDPARAVSVRDLMQVGMPYANLMIPDALQIEDVERWGLMLQATDPQVAYMRDRYAQHVERHNAFMQRDGSHYIRECASVGGLRATVKISSPEYIQALKTHLATANKFQSELERLENVYIDSIIPALSESQVELLYVLRNEASRRQSRCFHHLTRWTDVDLRRVWEAMWSDSVSQSDNRVMGALLIEYESRVTPLLHRAAMHQREASIEALELFAQANAGHIDSQTLDVRHRSICDRIGDAFRRVREATEDAVAQASLLLSSETARRFFAEARMAAYPELYPDASEYDCVFERVLASEHVRDDVKAGVRDLQAAYREEYQAVCRDMETMCIEWGDQNARGVNGYQSQFLAGALAPLLEKRTQVSLKWLAFLRDLAGHQLVDANMPSGAPMVRSPLQLKATSAGRFQPDRQFKPVTIPSATPALTDPG